MTRLVLKNSQRDIDRHYALRNWFAKQTPEENDTRLDLGTMDAARIRDELKMIERELLFLLKKEES